jgi:hypothetical protein
LNLCFVGCGHPSAVECVPVLDAVKIVPPVGAAS